MIGAVGIVRTAEWLLNTETEQAAQALREGLGKLDVSIEDDDGLSFKGSAKRAMMKNRWAAEWDVSVEPRGQGSLAIVRVEMNGTKHYELLDELAEEIGEVISDRGLDAAVERLGKIGRAFGRKEVRRARHMLHNDEEVIQLGQGKYADKMGIVILTDQRLFFFEKSIGSQSVEEFPLKSISSVSVSGKIGGEKLTIHSSGNVSEISQLQHGQGDELARQIRSLLAKGDEPAPAIAAVAPDAIDQLKRLAELRDSGIIDEAEFAEKKAELLQKL